MFRSPTRLLAPIAVASLVLASAAAATESTPSAGTAASATNLIAFTSRRDGDSEIYLIRADGGGLRKLTSNRAGDFRPAWSPDGTRIVFASDRHGNEELYVMAFDGSRVQRLTRHPAADGTPAWSPDGSRIAFTRTGTAGPEILVMNADGTEVRRASPRPRNGNGSTLPSWAPDGRLLAFGGSFETPENQEIYVARPDGGGLRRLTRTKGDVHTLGDDGMPAWSPNGRLIAFTSNRTGGGELWLMRPDGTGQRRFAGLPRRDDWSPAWSHDGRRLAFASLGPGTSAVYVVRADGKGLRRLTAGEDPAWSPPRSPIRRPGPAK